MWSSLEIAKLVVSVLVPISLIIFGYWTKNALLRQERESKISDRIILERAKIYESIGAPLNDIFCYIEEIGHYKDLTPDLIIEDRRKLHQIMHTKRAYWSHEMFAAFLYYMDRHQRRRAHTISPWSEDEPYELGARLERAVHWNAPFGTQECI